MNIQFNIDWHGHLDISQYVREAEPKQRNADVRSAIYGRTDQNKIELYLDDDAEYAPLVSLPYHSTLANYVRRRMSRHGAPCRPFITR